MIVLVGILVIVSVLDGQWEFSDSQRHQQNGTLDRNDSYESVRDGLLGGFWVAFMAILVGIPLLLLSVGIVLWLIRRRALMKTLSEKLLPDSDDMQRQSEDQIRRLLDTINTLNDTIANELGGLNQILAKLPEELARAIADQLHQKLNVDSLSADSTNIINTMARMLEEMRVISKELQRLNDDMRSRRSSTPDLGLPQENGIELSRTTVTKAPPTPEASEIDLAAVGDKYMNALSGDNLDAFRQEYSAIAVDCPNANTIMNAISPEEPPILKEKAKGPFLLLQVDRRCLGLVPNLLKVHRLYPSGYRNSLKIHFATESEEGATSDQSKFTVEKVVPARVELTEQNSDGSVWYQIKKGQLRLEYAEDPPTPEK